MTRTKGRMCSGKVRYADKAAADAVMARMVEQGAAESRLNTYRCNNCDGGWHVGHLGRRGGVS